jgi:hypothetical protein
MFIESPAKCAVVKKVTPTETIRCDRPAQIVLALHVPEPVAICLECANEMHKELDADLEAHWIG